MVNTGSIVVNSLLQTLMKPEMSTAEKFDYVNDYIKRMAGGEFVGFNNSVFLAEKEVADRNYALAYYMKENNCFPKGVNVKDCLDFWYQVRFVQFNIGCMQNSSKSLSGILIDILHDDNLRSKKFLHANILVDKTVLNTEGRTLIIFHLSIAVLFDGSQLRICGSDGRNISQRWKMSHYQRESHSAGGGSRRSLTLAQLRFLRIFGAIRFQNGTAGKIVGRR